MTDKQPTRITLPKPIVRIDTRPPRSPWRWILPLLMLLALSAAAVYWLLLPRLQALPLRPLSDPYEVEELRLEITELREQNAALERELAFAKRSAEIDREANRDLTESLAEQQKQVLKTSEELNFYKNIVSEDGVAEAVNLRSVELLPATEPRTYQMKLVVTRSGARQDVVKGNVELRVQGIRGGKSITLDWNALRSGKQGKPAFGFQYFQNIEALFRLPEDFEPENVLVKVVPGGKLSPVQQSFSWNSIVKEVNENVREQSKGQEGQDDYD